MPENIEQSNILHRVVGSARNLMPSSFHLAADPKADLKARWAAFDQIYEFVVGSMASVGTPLMPDRFTTEGLTDLQVQTITQRSMRYSVAAMLLTMSYGADPGAIPAVIGQAEVLVPSGPDPDTLRPILTGEDHVVLYEATRAVAEDAPDDFHVFYKADSVPLDLRRLAFLRMYACIARVWREHSEFARTMSPEQRQSLVAFALMCCVPPDQWTSAGFVDLRNELLPVEEPDWEELSRRVDPPLA